VFVVGVRVRHAGDVGCFGIRVFSRRAAVDAVADAVVAAGYGAAVATADRRLSIVAIITITITTVVGVILPS